MIIKNYFGTEQLLKNELDLSAVLSRSNKNGAAFMNVTNKQYDNMTKKMSPPSAIYKNCAVAFLVGGLICAAGQALTNLYIYAGLSSDDAATLVSVTLIFLAAAATGLNFYDNIAKHAGAGTLIPITGFSNAIVSPAMEFKSEGLVMGLSAKMFVVAGPVLVYGISTSVLYGVIIYLFSLV